jgi:hypothetical protein
VSRSKPIRLRGLCIVIVLGAGMLQAQEEDRTRKLWDTNLLTNRPPANGAGAVKLPVSAKTDDALIGITLWRLRPSKPGDEPGVRALIHERQGTSQWTPERTAAATPLREGEKVRISVETARTGYLYVIDRDEYANGVRGVPYLIYPTARTRGGNNKVAAGTLIEIPARDDNPMYFTVERSRADQITELLTILVTTEPIATLHVGPERLKAIRDASGGLGEALEGNSPTAGSFRSSRQAAYHG